MIERNTFAGLGALSLFAGFATEGAVDPGETKTYQLWYRDPQSSPCGFKFNLSNGVELTWEL